MEKENILVHTSQQVPLHNVQSSEWERFEILDEDRNTSQQKEVWAK